MIIDSLIPIVIIVGREGSATERPDRDLSRKRIVCYWRDVKLVCYTPNILTSTLFSFRKVDI